MSEFAYQAINESGNKVTGVIEAENRNSAAALLSSRGYIPIELSEQRTDTSSDFWERVKNKFKPVRTPELILFTKQLRTLFRAGVPILTIFQALENQTENERLRSIVVSISQDVREGSSLHDAFVKYPDVFSPLYCSMIKAGETSGALQQILDRLIYLIEHEHKIRSDIRSAMIYPAIVIIFLMSAVVFLLTFIVPKFVSVFEKTGIDLPLPTVICLRGYQLFSTYWYLFIFGAVALFVGLTLYMKTESGRYMRDKILMDIPIIGQLLVKAAMSRFSSIFSILQSSGISVLESMKILRQTINNAAIAREFDTINDRLEQGRGISGPLRSSEYFTPIVINMVAVGEESGSLDDMLHDVSLHYDAEMEYGLKRMTDAIGPILTIGLAVIVGFFALAIYLPMWDMTKMAR